MTSGSRAGHPGLFLPPRRKRSRWPFSRRWTIRVGLGLVGVLVALVVVALIQYLPAYNALQQGRTDVLGAETVLRSAGLDPSSDQLTAATTLLDTAKLDFGQRSSVIDDGWIVGALAHLPGLDRQVAAVRALRYAGEDGTNLALDLIPVLQTLHSGSAGGGSGVIKELALLGDTERKAISRAVRDLGSLDAAVAAIPGGSLFGPLDRLRTAGQQAQQRLDGPVRTGLTILQTLPRVVGTGTHRYLLLLTNPGEERGGGGYIGAAGTVVFQDGQLVSSNFMASTFSDALVNTIPAPAPIEAITGTNLVLGDADWSPNFPTTAALAAEFYTRATGLPVDGVIDVDPIALSYVLKVIGDVQVPPYPQVVSATNSLLELNYIINSARPGDPGKVYLAPFGHAVVDAALKTPRSKWVALATALERGAAERHIVLDFNDAQLEQLVVNAGLGGVLPLKPTGDALLVADSNLSGTKGDLFVTRHYALSATVNARGDVQDRLTLTYYDPPEPVSANAALLANSAGLYEDYIRVYLPPSATFEDLQVSENGTPAQSVSPEDIGVEDGRPWVSFDLVLDVNGTAALTFVYGGPFAHVAPNGTVSYQLAWEKQINALTWPVSFDVQLPTGNRYRFQSDLSTDRRWSVG
ncbi:MAG TPA: DUF4012 domain-containing protein [Candidatus Acidoferrum sp.]|nr:DUF4012 domain-containing protein [Candidatus Acidoferrum sp.]